MQKLGSLAIRNARGERPVDKAHILIAFLTLALLGACADQGGPCDGACIFVAGSPEDPVLHMKGQALIVDNTGSVDLATAGGTVTLFTDDFADGAFDLLWPSSVGYLGDFNGEWITDGNTARPINPTWPQSDPNAPGAPGHHRFCKRPGHRRGTRCDSFGLHRCGHRSVYRRLQRRDTGGLLLSCLCHARGPISSAPINP